MSSPWGCSMGGRKVSVKSTSFSVQPCDRPFQAANHSLPAVGCALIEALVFRTEARLLHAHKRAAFRRRQRPRDDGLWSRRRLFARGAPAIREPFIWLDDQDLAVGYAIPLR